MTLTILPTVHHRGEDFPLDPVVVESVWQMEERHFWHAARNRWIADGLRRYGVSPPAKFLDVGCGSGFVACWLQRRGYEVTGLDTSVELLRKADERCPTASFVAADVGRLPESFHHLYDAAGFFDVLEHLDDPQSFVRSALDCVKPGGLVLATVPALRSLHTVIDDLSGHKRRFELGELAELLGACGLLRVSEHGIFRTSIPIIRAFRWSVRGRDASRLSESERRTILRRNLRVPARPINAALGLLCRAERRLGLGAARNRAGATLMAAGFRPTAGGRS